MYLINLHISGTSIELPTVKESWSTTNIISHTQVKSKEEKCMVRERSFIIKDCTNSKEHCKKEDQ